MDSKALPTFSGCNGSGDHATAKSFMVARSVRYKELPSFPLKSSAVNLSHSNLSNLHPACSGCFPSPPSDLHGDFVDLLQFSNFNGIPWPQVDTARPRQRWLADVRYTWSTPLRHKFKSVRNEVVASERVQSAIARDLALNGSSDESSARKKVFKFFYEIRASISRVVCKICAYVLAKIFRRLMTHLYVSPKQMRRLQEAHNTGIPLVYLPLHRSHLDYLLITWNAWHFGLPLPHIASGDNLNLSGFGWLLRATGAFFIRRRIDPSDEGGKDIIYRAVLHSYLEQLLKKGYPIEFFLEGTRSRFGKSLLPKHGLISNIVQAVQQGIIEDCYLVPVSYTYDQVAEGIFLDELMGIPKVRESFLGAIRGVFKCFGASEKCGSVRMHFGQPVLLSDYISSLSHALMNNKPLPYLTRMRHSYSYRELVPWHRNHEDTVDHRSLIRAIGVHVVYEAQMMNSISLVSVVSALLLCKHREGVDVETLSMDIKWMCREILKRGSDVMGWKNMETDGRQAIEYVIPHVRESIDCSNDRVRPILSHRQLIQLCYSKNSLVPLFSVKSAIALVYVSRPKALVTMEEFLGEVLYVTKWLQFDFIFCRPCEDLTTIIREEVREMSKLGQLFVSTTEEKYENCEIYLDESFETMDETTREVLIFYSNMIRPFLQSLYLVCDHLTRIPSYPKEQEFIRNICKLSLDLKLTTFQPLLEAINSDSFKNSLNTLRETGILRKGTDIHVLESKKLDEVRLKILELLKIYR